MKKTIFILIIILSLLSWSLLAFSKDNKSDEEILKEKVLSEIIFLDSELTNMINRLNGLTFENYKIITTDVNKGDKDNSSNTEQSSGNASEKTSDSSSEGSDEQSNQESNSGSNSSSSQESNSSSGSTSKNAKKYTMTFNSILTDELNPEWDFVKQKIEVFFTSWNTMVIDLYKINVNKQDILNFNAELDKAIQNIKNEDKAQSLISIANLYSYIPKFYEAFSPDNTIELNVYKTKSEILNAYAIVENKSNEEIISHIKQALEHFVIVINNIDNKKNETSINKTYILINELQSSVPTRDIQLFYMKYKNLMEEINNIISNP